MAADELDEPFDYDKRGNECHEKTDAESSQHLGRYEVAVLDELIT
jgi:hypothetical protein